MVPEVLTKAASGKEKGMGQEKQREAVNEGFGAQGLLTTVDLKEVILRAVMARVYPDRRRGALEGCRREKDPQWGPRRSHKTSGRNPEHVMSTKPSEQSIPGDTGRCPHTGQT